jgi:hypothetical protein
MRVFRLKTDWPRRRKITIIATALTLLMVAWIVILVKNLNSPAIGEITPPTGVKIAPLATSKNPGAYSGQYISFNYPKNFDVIPSQKSGGILEVASLYSNDHAGKQVSISVIRESIANDSGVNYRRGHPELYKQTKDSKDNLVFTKNQNGSEYTAFLVHGDLVASISLSSNYTKDLSADYQAIAKNWQWK